MKDIENILFDEDFSEADLEKLGNSLIMWEKRRGIDRKQPSVRLSLGIALTKALKKDTHIDDLTTNVEAMQENYTKVEEENTQMVRKVT